MKFESIGSLQQSLIEKKTTVQEVVESYLQKAQTQKTNSVLTVMRDRALQQAKKQDQELQKTHKIPSNQPLFGVPLGVKDLIVIEGVRTTCGSKMLENYVPPYTATCLAQVESQGAISIAKLNLDEFAMGGSNENSAFGPVKHPMNLEYVPGGSSGGSAASVREGSSLVSLGSDTGGSIRLPASYCGLVGIKPTYGRVSRYGVVAFASSLDQVGPLALNTEDAALVLRGLCAPDPRDSTSAFNAKPILDGWQKRPLKGLRVGVPEQFVASGIDPAQILEVKKACAELEAAGALISEVSLPNAPHSVAVYYLVAVSEASTNLSRMDGVRFGYRPEALHVQSLEEFYSSCRSAFGAEVKRRILLGTFALSSGYYDAFYQKACQVRRLIQNDFKNVFSKVDVLLSPISPSGAFKIGEKVQDPLKLYLNDLLTIPASLAGIPGMSVPRTLDGNQLPMGLQIMAPWFEEERMLRVGQFLERCLPLKGGAH